ncbi:hypothetical protein FHS57_001638 [Runella defluvii]|uniref:Toprim domain-containing protein n=1 Tax=Runella defluvii TaxID=370973 RepID=A0A7W5ZKV2_9BACT|nr:DUF6371 domain-containing protein [Runella defluvii]MBB3837641.1 hypothetical protein [Runella defluvii]
MSNYFFQFEKHPKKKGTCPNCGHQDCFRYYEKDGIRMDTVFGKCERINSCGYHSHPDGNTIPLFEIAPLALPTEQNKQLVLPDQERLKKMEGYLNNLGSNFHQYCLSLGVDELHLRKHGVGTSSKGHTVFVFKNFQGQIVNAKWVTYSSDGKRDKKIKAFSMKQPIDPKTRYGLCLYGEDLLDPEMQKTVVIVESEKTKVIASFFYPDWDWVSCGSANGLTDEKVEPLKGRKVVWLCDADKAGRQASSIECLKRNRVAYEIIDLFPERSDGYDIADSIQMKIFPKLTIPDDKTDLKQDTEVSRNTVDYRKDGSIWVQTKKNWSRVSNFHLFIKYLAEDDLERKSWILELHKRDISPVFLEVSHEDFCSTRRLKNIMTAKELSLKVNEEQWEEIIDYLFALKRHTAVVKVNKFGYHKLSDLYLFANHAVTSFGEMLSPDDFGIVTNNGCSISMPKVPNGKKHRFTLTHYQITFNEWFEAYCETHLWENAFLPMSFYIMSLYRDILVRHKGFSPILFAKGPAGTGKSSLIRSITHLFGGKQDDINLKSKNTDVALIKLMSQAINTIIWMDEYENNMPQEGILQAAYDNSGYHRTPDNSRNSSDTESIDINSAVALTSNFIPQNPIFFSRCLFLPIYTQQKTQKQNNAYIHLSSLESNGLGAVTVELVRHRRLIEDNYLEAFSLLYKELKDRFQNERLPERLFANMSQALTCAYILHINGKIRVCESVDKADVLEDFVSFGEKSIRRQFSIQSDTSVLTEFFNILQVLYEQNKIHAGIHYRIDKELLYLRFPSIYPLFLEKYRNVFFKTPPDKDSIVTEILQMELPRQEKEVCKTIRFRSVDRTDDSSLKDMVSNSFSVRYEFVKKRFGLEFSS